MNSSLEGRTAVVTGAAGGIGREIARECVRLGARVHALDRDSAGLAALVEEGMGMVVAEWVDLGNRVDADRAAQAVLTRLQHRCDILVNNAGISRVEPFASSDDALLDRLLATNFVSAFRLTRSLLPALQRSPAASIVNIASELALVGQSGYSAYSATKGAILAWSRALAVELAPQGIRVNAVCPGPIDTQMIAAEFALAADPLQARRAEVATVPLGRLGRPSDIASVVGFLAGDAAAFVSGAAWPVDGGKTAA